MAPETPRMRCITCQDLHTPGVDAIHMNEGTPDECIQCAWCHRSEFGYWPHGMTMEGDEEDDCGS